MLRARKPVQRRDATGHLDPTYQRQLLARSRELRSDGGTSNRAFLAGPRTYDELGEELGEAYIQTATTGEESEIERHERQTEAETGGPFVATSAPEEVSYESDSSDDLAFPETELPDGTQPEEP